MCAWLCAASYRQLGADAAAHSGCALQNKLKDVYAAANKVRTSTAGVSCFHCACTASHASAPGLAASDSTLRSFHVATRTLTRLPHCLQAQTAAQLGLHTCAPTSNVQRGALIARLCAGSADPTEVLTKEMDKLMETLEPGTKKDVALIKDKVFGSQVFWVTEARPDLGRSPGTYLVRAS